MAVRIALQCSEADAHLILSEDNTAARLLTRPGEAIYNDANGLYEGNHPFQIVWLPDGERDDYLQRISRAWPSSGIARRRRRSFSRATSWPTWATTQSARSCSRPPHWPDARRDVAGLARLGGGHQGPDRGRLPAARTAAIC